MYAYFLRRLLLLIPTFVAISFIAFMLTRIVPGGPVELALMKYRAMASGEGGGGGGTSAAASGEVSEAMIEKLKAIYGFDKDPITAYGLWFSRLVRLDLGESYRYSEPVWDVIKKRFPVSLYFGLLGFLLTYTICIPLGVWKAIRHGSRFDVGTSMLVFAGYAIPGWSAGVVLLVLFGGGSYWNLVPLGGFVSEGFNGLGLFGKLSDLAWHTFLPVSCYMVGQFATLTVLMKNSLMENLGQDYVRTAFAKGLTERVVVFKHTLRNSLIPIATGLGHALSLVVAGSYLIEYTFDIRGFGYLGYESIVERDYPIVLGILVISSTLRLLGNIFSDMLYCLIDPRIRFE